MMATSSSTTKNMSIPEDKSAILRHRSGESRHRRRRGAVELSRCRRKERRVPGCPTLGGWPLSELLVQRRRVHLSICNRTRSKSSPMGGGGSPFVIIGDGTPEGISTVRRMAAIFLTTAAWVSWTWFTFTIMMPRPMRRIRLSRPVLTALSLTITLLRCCILRQRGIRRLLQRRDRPHPRCDRRQQPLLHQGREDWWNPATGLMTSASRSYYLERWLGDHLPKRGRRRRPHDDQ